MTIPFGALLFAIAACGRFDFDPHGPDAALIEPTIALTVLEGDNSPNPDAPVANAYVVLDDGSIVMTDGAGRVDIPAPIPRTFHVIYDVAVLSVDGTPHWRVTSFADVPSGIAMTIGSRSYASRPHGTFTFQVPVLGSAAQYEVWVPARCLGADGVVSSTTAVSATLDLECEGLTVQGYAIAYDAGLNELATARVGPVTLTDNGVYPFAVWTAGPAPTPITILNLPTGALDTFVAPMFVGPVDVISLETSGFHGPPPSPAQINPILFDQPNMIGIAAVGATTSTSWAAPLDSSNMLDASSMMPLAGTPGVDPVARTITWGDTPTADLVRTGATLSGTTTVDWVAYVPPVPRSITFPALPAELAMIDPGPGATWLGITTQGIDVGGEDRVALLAHIDRDITYYMSWDGYMPPGGLAISAGYIP